MNCVHCNADNLDDYPLCADCRTRFHMPHRPVCLHCKEETDETRRDYDGERMDEGRAVIRLLVTRHTRDAGSSGRTLEVA